MNFLEIMEKRRSIRKYQDRQISRDDLEKIINAGLYAPNAEGRESPYIVGIQNRKLVEKLGELNCAAQNRITLDEMHAASENSSVRGASKTINAFYGAPTVCAIFADSGFFYSIMDCYCSAGNMTLMALSLGISSCIIARGYETFNNPDGKRIISEFNLPPDYEGCCFVALGYCKGPYPGKKAIKQGRFEIIE